MTTPKSLYFLFNLLFLLAIQNANATNYYVDAKLGNDQWTGTQNVPNTTSTDGPWLTLSKVSATTLKPGDSVFLSCGSTWNETLSILNSGTATAPIYVGSYPTGCGNRPRISGSRQLLSYNWVLDHGNVYKAKLPANLLINGDLNSSTANWGLDSPANTAKFVFEPTCPNSATPCASFTSGIGSQRSNLTPNSFTVESGTDYTVSFMVYAPLGKSYSYRVFKNSTNIDYLNQSGLVGTGGWQQVTQTFKSTLPTIYNGRFDLYLPSDGTKIYVKNVSISRTVPDSPIIVTMNGAPLDAAHHPNVGYDATKPTSGWLTTGAGSSIVLDAQGRKRSDYIVAATDQQLPANASITSGLNVTIRSANWEIDTSKITSVVGNKIYVSPQTFYPTNLKGWGYYYTGALWMLDSPREWYFDKTSSNLYVWTPDGLPPGKRVSYSSLVDAIFLPDRSSYVTIENLSILSANIGINMWNGKNIIVNDVDFHNIDYVGLSAGGATNSSFTNNYFENIAVGAIHGLGSSNLTITGNDILNNGVLYQDGQLVGMPIYSFAAISTGTNSTVSNNIITGAAGLGIYVDSDSSVTANAIYDTCRYINDCGAIYATNKASNLTITDNIIRYGTGTTDGVSPPAQWIHAVGIYLDSGVSNSLVQNNTVADAIRGMQLHNGAYNQVLNNKFYGHDKSQLWIQENSNALTATGDVHDVTVKNNTFFRVKKDIPSVYNQTSFTDTAHMATYDNNVYSNLLEKKISGETNKIENNSYTFKDWKNLTVAGVARNLDKNSVIAAPTLGYAVGLFGSNLNWNSAFQYGTSSWGWSSTLAPSPVTSIQKSCATNVTNCMLFTAGGGVSAFYTPKFNITKDVMYRVSFDIKSSSDTQKLAALVRSAGPTNYDSVMGDSFSFPSSQVWKKVNFHFIATRSIIVNDPVTGEKGARLDFTNLKPGESVSISNVEITPINIMNGTPIETALLDNPSRDIASVDCPTLVTNAAACASFVGFPDGQPVSWPVSLAPLSSKIVFTQALDLPDADKDGVADSQDKCPLTAKELDTDAKGCAFGQIPLP